MTSPDAERIMLEEVPLVIETTYHQPEDASPEIRLEPGGLPFILFQMKQKDGAVVLDVTASLIEGEEELIETLEAFFEAMLEDRMQRGLIQIPAEDTDNEEADRG